jgi:membrane protein YdbS with pleckstrin-like domain
MERLDSRVRIAWAVGTLVSGFVLGTLVAVGLAAVAREWVPLGALVTLLVGALGLVLAVLRYRRWRFELQADALYLERGVLTQVRTVVPFVRVQHVDTQRSPVERLLGLSSVVVYTAGSRSADVTVPGLTPDRADELQARLRELAVETDPGDAV